MNNPDTTQIIVLIGVLVIALAVMAWILVFLSRLRKGRGPLGSVLQHNHELVRESLATAKEGLQLERELLATQKETNELLKQALDRIEKKT
jgi:F0F1-type ATP synthase membrane subunit b/b'